MSIPKRHLEHLSVSQMALVIEAAPVAMLIIDSGGSIKVANSHAGETFGYRADQLIGMNVEELIPVQFRPSHQKHVAAFVAAMVPRVMGVGREVLALHADGHDFPVEIGLSPMQSQGGILIVAAIINITERRQRERESTLARLVQESMLPQIPDDLPGLELAARSDPADATGGDFYDLMEIGKGQFELVIGDASGHGFAAALVTAAARSYLRALSRLESNLGEILKQANRLLIDDVLESRFVTLMIAILDPDRLTLTYTGAGHIGYLLNPDGSLAQLLDQNGPPLGWFVEAQYPVTMIELMRGSILVLLTDGIEEAMDSQGLLFGRQRVLDLLRREHQRSVSEIVSLLHAEVHKFCGDSKPHDDATVIVARVR